jgi:hypothetical protein
MNCYNDIASSSIKALGQSFPLKFHPGFPLMLGCNQWSASGLEGTVEGWSNTPDIHWISKSIAARNGLNTDSQSKTWQVIECADVFFQSGASNDVPHLRYSIRSYESIAMPHLQKTVLSLDYLPRVDMVGDMAYFDKYYTGLDTYNKGKGVELSESADCFSATYTDSGPLRLVSSPVPLNLYFKRNSEAMEERSLKLLEETQHHAIETLCNEAVDRWHGWLRSSFCGGRQPTTHTVARDVQVQKLVLEDYKIDIAAHMGGAYAPKADDVATAFIGPPADSSGP